MWPESPFRRFNMIESEIRDMQIRAKRIESAQAKGKKISDDDCKNVCMSYKNVVDGLSASYPEEDFHKEIDSRCYTLSPLLVPFYIKEIVVDIADLAKRAFDLMLENMRTPAKPKEKSQAYEPQAKAHDAKQYAVEKPKKKQTAQKTYESAEQDKMSVQQKNNQKITGKYEGSLDNVRTARSREQKAMVERQQRQSQANAIAHEQTTSEPEHGMSMSND